MRAPIPWYWRWPTWLDVQILVYNATAGSFLPSSGLAPAARSRIRSRWRWSGSPRFARPGGPVELAWGGFVVGSSVRPCAEHGQVLCCR